MSEVNFHTNAAALIVTAAEKSGLLHDIAQALCYVDKTHHTDGIRFACALRDELIEAFDEHICLASSMLESFYSEGFGEAPEEEVAPYLGISSTSSTSPIQTKQGE